MNKKDLEHLQFIYDRLLLVHGEKSNVDFMRKLYHIIQTNSKIDFEKSVVMEFSHEEIPIFSQGFQNRELLEIVTAERCTAIMQGYVDNYQNAQRYLRWRKDAFNPEGLDEVMDKLIEEDLSGLLKSAKKHPTTWQKFKKFLSRLF